MARTLLIVGGAESGRQALCALLGSEYRLLEAADNREAFSMLRQSYTYLSAVVLSDWDGGELLGRISINPMLSQVPVFVVSLDRALGMEARALAIGAQDYIETPADPGVVRLRLRNLIKMRESSAILNALHNDELTGLYNRKTFITQAARRIASCPPGYYVLSRLNIHHFKAINERYGTAKGDEVLKQVAHILKRGIDTAQGLSCRVNMDVFYLLYPRSMLASGALEELRHEASILDGSLPPITISIGRYIIDDPTLPVSAMMDRAALAEATVKGRYDRHIAVYDDSMRERFLLEQEITNEMNLALTSGQFEPWFQPQYNHVTGALTGAEALVRWRHPEKGLIPPNKFVPIFERNGFIYEMDQYVWRQACRYLRKWLDEGRAPPPLSVNISRYDVFREDLVDVLSGLMAEYALPTELLRLEITESAFSESAEQIISVVRRLIALGFTVEIDDFGSGYSSLNTLKDVPAQVLKLDMRFLESSGATDRGGNILESVVRMTKWLGMAVIAEGVETVEQADYLRSIGCSYVQGYLYAHPMPSDDYERLMTESGKEERLLAMQTVENLDNNTFWNPESMDTLIFNSYVGTACIFEYYEGRIELLRVSKKNALLFTLADITVDDALKLDWTSYLDAGDRRRVAEALERSIQTRDDVSCEVVFHGLPKHPEDASLSFHLRVVATAGEHRLVYGTYENLTAQRKAEKRERELAEQMTSIMANINGGVSAATWDGAHAHYLFANDRFYAMLGYTREQFERELPRGLRDLLHPEDEESAVHKHGEHMRLGKTSSGEFRVRRRDGSILWLRANASVCRFDGVERPVNLAVYTDVTREKLAAQKEREAAQRLRALMDGMPGGVFAVAVGEDGAMRLVFSNDQFFATFGYTREQYLQTSPTPFDTVLPDELPELKERLAAMLKTREPFDIVRRCCKRDGETVHVRGSFSVMRDEVLENDVILALTTDVTEAVAVERHRHDAHEQMRFVNAVAHELLAQSEVSVGIERALHSVLEHFGASRAYIFEIDEARRLADNTYEVCAEGVSAQIDGLQGVPLSFGDGWWPSLNKGEHVYIDDVSALPDSRRDERELLTRQAIRSLIVVPLERDDRLIGFLGVDDPTRNQSHVERLHVLGGYLSSVLKRCAR